MSDLILGRHPVLECLIAERPVNKVLLANNLDKSDTISRILALAKKAQTRVEFVDKKALDRLAEGQNHQGVIAFAAAHEYVEVEDIIAVAKDRSEVPFIVLLDNLEDPHNLGAILRTADAAGAHGVVITKHRSVSLNTTVAKASSGAIEHVPVAMVNNLNECIRKLKDQRIWVFGLDGSGEIELGQADLKLPLAIVVGGEGQGLSQMVKKNCDFVVKIPMRGKINSLNASVAAAVMMYEVVRQRKS